MAWNPGGKDKPDAFCTETTKRPGCTVEVDDGRRLWAAAVAAAAASEVEVRGDSVDEEFLGESIDCFFSLEGVMVDVEAADGRLNAEEMCVSFNSSSC